MCKTFLVGDRVRRVTAGYQLNAGGIQMLQNSNDCLGGATVAKYETFAALNADIVLLDHVKEAGKIRVVSFKATVLVDDRIDRSDGGGVIVHRVQIRDDILLVRDRHVDCLKIVLCHKCIKVLSADRAEIICIVCKLLMDLL